MIGKPFANDQPCITAGHAHVLGHAVGTADVGLPMRVDFFLARERCGREVVRGLGGVLGVVRVAPVTGPNYTTVH